MMTYKDRDEGEWMNILKSPIKQNVLGFVSFAVFGNYFVTVVCNNERTVHCDMGSWGYVSVSIEYFEKYN